MRYINDVFAESSRSIKKRAAIEFGNSKITKTELDDICVKLDEVGKILNKVKRESPLNAEAI